MDIFYNNVLVAVVELNGEIQTVSESPITEKINKLVAALADCPTTFSRIEHAGHRIKFESSSFNDELSGICPAYRDPADESIHVLDSLPLYFLIIVVIFESYNTTNSAMRDVSAHISSFKNADDYATAYETAEYMETYQQAMQDVINLHKRGSLSIPWYIPVTTDKYSITGMGIRLLSQILPAKFMIRYLAPLDLQDWLTETNRKPWFFFGSPHSDMYRETFRTSAIVSASSSNPPPVSTSKFSFWPVPTKEPTTEAPPAIKDKITPKK